MQNPDDYEVPFAHLTDKERVAYDNAYGRVYGQTKSHYAADIAGQQALVEYRRAERLRREARQNGGQS